MACWSLKVCRLQGLLNRVLRNGLRGERPGVKRRFPVTNYDDIYGKWSLHQETSLQHSTELYMLLFLGEDEDAMAPAIRPGADFVF